MRQLFITNNVQAAARNDNRNFTQVSSLGFFQECINVGMLATKSVIIIAIVAKAGELKNIKNTNPTNAPTKHILSIESIILSADFHPNITTRKVLENPA